MITNQLPDWTNYDSVDTLFTVVLNTDCTKVQSMDRNQPPGLASFLIIDSTGESGAISDAILITMLFAKRSQNQ